MSTNDLKSNSYVYKDDNRYFLNKGTYIQVCHIHNCNNETNNKKCYIHINLDTKLCRGTKCNNYFISNEFNFCENCRHINNKSKMKTRYNLYDLKIKLGGKCTECGTTELFNLEFDHINPKSKMKTRYNLYDLKIKLGGKCTECGTTELFNLEFDHINPKFKTKQITKIHQSKLEKELENIQLLCSICHRIKSFNEQKIKRCKNSKHDKKLIVQNIKRKIGGCQICNWTHKDNDILSYCLDFDHIYGEKYKQISNLYLYKKERILEEIEKCRLLCRACHQMWSCFQRGGKMLYIYYNKEQIQYFKNLLDNSDKNIEYNKRIKEIIQVYR